MAHRIRVQTREREQLLDITDELRRAVRDSGTRNGVVHLWTLHTTCALTVNEGADPDVSRDMVAALRRLVPREAGYAHAEGNSDSHIKTSLFGPGITLLIEDGDLLLGTWQRLFLAEWDGPRRREVAAHFVERFGEWILLAPTSAVAWILPFVALIVGGICLGLSAATWLFFRYRPGGHD
jgi:secondary thiamine-phosphate synthase enzyme